jgi:hypothetical protein
MAWHGCLHSNHSQMVYALLPYRRVKSTGKIVRHYRHIAFRMTIKLRRWVPVVPLLGLLWAFTLATSSIISSQPSAGQSGEQVRLLEIGVRNGHAMAYDSGRGRVVLFGGADAMQVRGDTWEWDGDKWTQVSRVGPGPRTFPAMTYDSVRRRVVLFGGNRVLFGRNPEENKYLDDAWEWDGRQWRENRSGSTQGRFNCVMAYDAERRRIIRFGGNYAGQRFGDTWEYDGKEWRQLVFNGPAARNHSAMAYDSKRKRITLFGGHDGENVFGDTWEWDGFKWLQREAVVAQKRIQNGH